jgi:hypothetical protein
MRTAHHRTEYRTGPHHSWLRRKAYHLTKLFRHVWASVRMAESMRWLSPGVYAINPTIVSQWKGSIDDAVPYAQDQEGTVWE